MSKKCICDICTCGRCRCLQKPNALNQKGDGSNNVTEYKNVYKQHPIQMREAFKPNADVMSGGQFHDSTTQRQDYIKHPLERPYHRVPDQYKKPMGEMEGVTSYKKDYTEKYAPPAQAIKHEGQRQVGGKFEGEPTYKSDYRKWDMSGRMGPYIAQDAWQPPTQPFEGETTFKHDFRKHEAARRGMIRPDEAAKMSDAPFNDRTDYRDSYIKHPLEAKYVHPKEQYKGPSAPFEDITTFKRDYKGNPGEMTRSFKPDNQAFSSGKPLEDVTTNRNDFRRWPLERPYVHQQEQYKKPEGAFESATTHNMTYRELPLERVLARRPDSANKARNAPFEGATSYNNDYKKWDMNGRGKPMMRDEYYPNTAPFEGLSTQKAHFIPHEIQKQKAFGPNRSAFQSNAKFEDSTMYRTDYTLKEMDICPALSINKVTFPIPCRRTQGGYKPVYETVTELPSGMGSPTRMQMVS